MPKHIHIHLTARTKDSDLRHLGDDTIIRKALQGDPAAKAEAKRRGIDAGFSKGIIYDPRESARLRGDIAAQKRLIAALESKNKPVPPEMGRRLKMLEDELGKYRDSK